MRRCYDWTGYFKLALWQGDCWKLQGWWLFGLDGQARWGSVALFNLDVKRNCSITQSLNHSSNNFSTILQL